MRRGFPASMLLLFSAFLFLSARVATAQSSANQGPQPITPAMEQKVDSMVQKLTLEQKIALIGGEDGVSIRQTAQHRFPAAEMLTAPWAYAPGVLRRPTLRVLAWQRAGTNRWRRKWVWDWARMRVHEALIFFSARGVNIYLCSDVTGATLSTLAKTPIWRDRSLSAISMACRARE